jgi:hypothetical protein
VAAGTPETPFPAIGRDRFQPVGREHVVVGAHALLRGADEHPTHDGVDASADDASCRPQAEERRRSIVVRDHRRQPDLVHRDAEALGDQLGGVDGTVAEQEVEREGPTNVADVQEVRFDVGDEELVEIERDLFGPLEVHPLGEELVEVVAGDLRRSFVREAGQAERRDLRRISRSCVPADVMAASREVEGDAGERIEVAVGRQ